jgi:hypothetical protein
MSKDFSNTLLYKILSRKSPNGKCRRRHRPTGMAKLADVFLNDSERIQQLKDILVYLLRQWNSDLST